MSARLQLAEAVEWLERRPLGELMARAHAERERRWPGRLVTFVRDTNPNYTNVCETGCRFCAFHRAPGAADGYLLTPAELAARAARAVAVGATTILLQGGANPAVRLRHWREYLRALRQACPEAHLHPFSPAEIVAMAQREGCATGAVLDALVAEGIDTLPGGGAEILAEAVHARLAPRKCTPAQWLAVMAEAHQRGLKTTATMMFGHVETPAELVRHLLRLRDLQDRTGGFQSFIPWSFKVGHSELGREVGQSAHPARYLRVIAVARLVLDNIPHLQSSWFSENERAGQLGLLAGADDFGGILIEESVLKEAGHEARASEARILAQIRAAGFIPARRDSRYRVLERLP